MREWLILSPSLPGRFDGIGDYAWHLTRAMTEYGPARMIVRSSDEAPAALAGVDSMASWQRLGEPAWRDRARASNGVLLQDLPQAFLRGDLRGCVRWLDQARAANRPVVVTIHEHWPPPDGRWRRTARRFVYNRVLAMLLARSTHVVLTYELAESDVAAAGLLRGRNVSIIPVGSNVERIGDRSGVGDGGLVLFGQPAAMHEPTMVAIGAWLSRRDPRIPMTWINRSAEEMREDRRTRVRQPESLVDFRGGLPPAEVSARLSVAAVGVAPYVNGVSTRRTTLAAMVQHGLPIAGLDGVATSEVLRSSGAMRLSPEGEPDAFTRLLEALVADRDGRVAMSAAADRLYREHLSWPCIARSYLAALGVAMEHVRA